MINFPIFPNSLFRNSKFLSCSTELYLFLWYWIVVSLLAELHVFQTSRRNLVCVPYLFRYSLHGCQQFHCGPFLTLGCLGPQPTIREGGGSDASCSGQGQAQQHHAERVLQECSFMAELWRSCWSSAVYFCSLWEQVLMDPGSSRWLCSVNGSQLCFGVAGNWRAGKQDWLSWCVMWGGQSSRW